MTMKNASVGVASITLSSPSSTSHSSPAELFADSIPRTTSSRSGAVRIVMPSSKSHAAQVPPKTLIQLLIETKDRFPNRPAMISCDDKKWTFTELYRDVVHFAKACLSLGVEKHSAVTILGFNSPEWFIACIGAVFSGSMAAGIYTTSTADACFYIADHSKASIAVVEGKEQLLKFLQIEEKLTHLKAVVVYNDSDVGDLKFKSKRFPTYTFQEFLNLSKDTTDATLQTRADSIKPNECASLIYTSGTTGPPKAAMASHDSIQFVVSTGLSHLVIAGEDLSVSYLPLSHIAAQVLDLWSCVCLGICVGFATADALQGALVKSLQKFRPTTFFGVPRVYEKIMEKMIAVGATIKSPVINKIRTWAKAKGYQNSMSLIYGSSVKTPSCVGLAHKLVFTKVRNALGLDRARFTYVGSAPMDDRCLKYFSSLNIQIFDGYGMSETCGGVVQNNPGAWKLGSIGKPNPGIEVKVVPDTGEMLIRGRCNMMGYLDMPDMTRETFDDDGFMHTGDKVRVDDDGFIFITGRLKELIKTSGGENVPPVLIENQVKDILKAVSNCTLIGDRKKFLSILITFKCQMSSTGEPQDDLSNEALAIAKEIGSDALTVTSAISCPKFRSYVEKGIKKYNDEFKISKAQVIQKFELLPVDFSVSGGELTATLKLKRPAVYKKYESLIKVIYDE